MPQKRLVSASCLRDCPSPKPPKGRGSCQRKLTEGLSKHFLLPPKRGNSYLLLRLQKKQNEETFLLCFSAKKQSEFKGGLRFPPLKNPLETPGATGPGPRGAEYALFFYATSYPPTARSAHRSRRLSRSLGLRCAERSRRGKSDVEE